MQGQHQPVSGNKKVQVGKVDVMDDIDAKRLQLVGVESLRDSDDQNQNPNTETTHMQPSFTR